MKKLTQALRSPHLALILSALFLLLLPLPVLAQDTTPDTPGGIAMTTGYLVGMGILAGAGALLAWWLGSKAATSPGYKVVQQLWLVAQAVVAHVDAKIRPTVTRALADGKLTPEERTEIQRLAMAAFKEAAGPKLLEQAQKVFGAGGTETLLSGLLEWALKRFKGEGAPPTALPPGVPGNPQ